MDASQKALSRRVFLRRARDRRFVPRHFYLVPDGFAGWTCPLDLPVGLARWTCPLDLPVGLARWTCPLDLPVGLARWTCPVDLPAGLGSCCLEVPLQTIWPAHPRAPESLPASQLQARSHRAETAVSDSPALYVDQARVRCCRQRRKTWVRSARTERNPQQP